MTERKHWNIVELGLSMLFHSSVPKKYWVKAFYTVVYLINRLPSLQLGMMSPYELLFNKVLVLLNKVPDYSLFEFLELCAFFCSNIWLLTNSTWNIYHVYFWATAYNIKVIVVYIIIQVKFIYIYIYAKYSCASMPHHRVRDASINGIFQI